MLRAINDCGSSLLGMAQIGRAQNDNKRMINCCMIFLLMIFLRNVKAPEITTVRRYPAKDSVR